MCMPVIGCQGIQENIEHNAAQGGEQQAICKPEIFKPEQIPKTFFPDHSIKKITTEKDQNDIPENFGKTVVYLESLEKDNIDKPKQDKTTDREINCFFVFLQGFGACKNPDGKGIAD
jgi:hypothetical protein